ncbi:type I polyketide synthase [Embleya scabrispora]|uniref:Type I polyketide synthase n=1 Tax=Embleya scabrispora TaxID=159449 RepID=A0A1T3P7G8_9ACTN|nr:type I polyketide synthase [Embleya scabrispora]
MSPLGRPDAPLVIAAHRAGALAVLDLGRERGPALAELARASALACFGVRVPVGCPLGPRELPERVDVVLLAPDAPWSIADAGPGRRVLVEVTSAEQAHAAVAGGAAGVVARGAESGGRCGELTTFVLLQQLLADARVTVPVWAAGGIGPHTAAAAVAGGAAGVLLDTQLALVAESTLPADVAAAVRAMDGSETVVIRGHRVYRRPDLPIDRLVASASGDLGLVLGAGGLRRELLPVGQDGGSAARLADRHGTAGRVVCAVREAIVGHLASAARHGARLRPVQGPMTRVSDRAAFAHEVARAGGLPFLALSLLRGREVRALLAETGALLGDLPWGAGLLGFAPPELREEQVAAVLAARPPYALIAGGRPDRAAPLEAAGIRTYLHAPSPGLLSQFLREGARRFVFEGTECGGHVGPRASFPLWETQVDTLLAFAERHGGAAGLDLLFAGGIHDARSAAMVAAATAPLVERGASVGVLMGTAYLFTREAVAGGAIVPGFQAAAVECASTALVQTAPGHATRCAGTPFVAAFEARRRELESRGVPAREMWAELERLNLGRLRIAGKGLRREADKLVAVDADVQRREGMFMLGQAAVLRSAPTDVAALHREVTAGSAAWLARRVREVGGVDRPAPPRPQDVAIVGMACVLPGAPDLASYWRNILAGVDAVTEVPRERWDVERYFAPSAEPGATARGSVRGAAPGAVPAGRTPSKWGGFVPAIGFDATGYGIPPASLAAIEPAQLLALHVASGALADAGYGPGRAFARERTSVIFGAEAGTDLAGAYGFRALFPGYFGALPADLDRQLPTPTEDSFPGVLANVIAGRIANRLDLGGVNFTVDAACAASLAALDLACKELNTGSSDLVLCGGVDTHNGINDYLMFSSVRALSPTGRCATFDADADGIALGEGAVCVLLKRLADAERDGDRIYAVVKGVGGSSDGRSLGLTAPRPEGQRRALERAYRAAGVSPARVGLVEAHGTGTVVGDRAELDTLTEVFTAHGAAPGACAVGSVKSQIGHTKCAAGLAGLAKAALAVHFGVHPPTLHLRRPPDAGPFVFDNRARPWTAPVGERIAGVSAFGFGGTNFHAVLAGSEPVGAGGPGGADAAWPVELFCFRGTDRAAAHAALDRLAARLDADEDLPLRGLAALADEAVEPRSDADARGAAEAPVQIALVAADHADLRVKLTLARAGAVDPAGEIFHRKEAATGAEAEAGSGTGAVVRPDVALGAGLGPEAGVGPDAGLHTGLGTETGMRPDTALDPGLGSEAGVRPGAALDPGLDTETGVRPGAALDPGLDTETGVRPGAALDPRLDTETGMRPDTALDPRLDTETGMRPDTALGPALDTEAGVRAGAALGLALDTEAGIRAGAGLDAGVGTEVGAGSDPGLGTGAGVRPGDRLDPELGSEAGVRGGAGVGGASWAGTGGQVAFLYPGQGSQRPGMLADLFARFPELCDGLRGIDPECVRAMFPAAAFDAEERAAQAARLTDTRRAQPALGVAAVALTRLLDRFGVWPDQVAGHSYGEVAALWSAGVLATGDLGRLGEVRAAAVLAAAGAEPGAMAAVTAGADRVAEVLAGIDGVVLANRNTPTQTVVSGPEAALTSAIAALADAGLSARRLPVACAFHSPVVAAAADTLAAAVADLDVRPPRIPVWSNGTAARYPDAPADIRALMARQVAEPVRFAEQIEAMYAAGVRIFVEAGPGRALTGMVGAILGDRPHTAVACDVPGEDGLRRLLTALAELAVAGVPVRVAGGLAGRVRPEDVAPGPRPAWTVDGHLVRTADGRPVPGGLRPATPMAPLSFGPVAEPGVPKASARDAVLLEYLAGARAAVAAQREVLLGYLGVPGGVPESPPIALGPEPTPVRVEPAPVRLEPDAPDAPDGPLTRAQVLDVVLDIVGTRTGYPKDMLDPALDLEADLSVDSIKRTEIIGELALRLRLPGGAGTGVVDAEPVDAEVIERLARVKTIDAIVAGVLDAGSAGNERTVPERPIEPMADEPAAPLAGRPTRHVVECVPIEEPPAPAPGDVEGPSPEGRLRGRRVVLVEDGGGIAWALADALAAHGVVVEARARDRVEVEAGADPGWAEVDTLVHLGALADGPDPVFPDAFPLLRDALVAGVRQVFLVTAGGGRFGRGPEAAGPDPVPGAGLAGFARAAALEYPDRVVRVLDLDAKAEPAGLAHRLLTELGRTPERPEPGAPVLLGLAGEHRVTLRPRPAPLPDLPPADRDALLRERIGPASVVLLTGGARGITARAAIGLARATGCHIELLGRTGLDEDPEPEATAAAPDAPALRAALIASGMREPARIEAESTRILHRREVRATLAEAAEHAASVRLHAADVTDADAVRRVLAGIAERHGRLDGIVHGAGVLADRLLADKSGQSCRRVFATKVAGARALVAALRTLRPTLAPPAFLAMFGSVAGVYGNRGQTDYAAANDALATLAWHWSAGSDGILAPVAGRVVTVDWGPWAATGGGMVTAELAREYARRGVPLIDPEHGVRALLDELAAGEGPQAVYVCLPADGSVAG